MEFDASADDGAEGDQPTGDGLDGLGGQGPPPTVPGMRTYADVLTQDRFLERLQPDLDPVCPAAAGPAVTVEPIEQLAPLPRLVPATDVRLYVKGVTSKRRLGLDSIATHLGWSRGDELVAECHGDRLVVHGASGQDAGTGDGARLRLDGKQRVLLPRHLTDLIGLPAGGQALVAVSATEVHVLPAAAAVGLLGLSPAGPEESRPTSHEDTSQEDAA